MIEFHMGYFVGAFLAAALAAVAWIGVCRWMPALRNRAGLRYGGAFVLSWLPAVLDQGGMTIYSVVATLAFDAALFFAVFYLFCPAAASGEEGGAQHSLPAH